MLATRAPAKINLTLHILGRRPDGYHALESLVVFSGAGDTLTLSPGSGLTLEIAGPTAPAAGDARDNLVLRAARALGERAPGIVCGAFRLEKRLPVAAGIGGGSSDAAAALRLLARVNGMAMDDPRLLEAARATGSDVPVCLLGRAARMRGAGEDVVAIAGFAPRHGVLVNPRVPVATPDVFRALGLAPGASSGLSAMPDDPAAVDVAGLRNDLAAPARSVAPVIAEVEAALARAGASLVRMSGSGASVVGLAAGPEAAADVAAAVARAHPGWWVAPVVLA